MSPETFVQDYFEHADYDPQKRRERYLRTRQLKGRKKGVRGVSASQEVRKNTRSAKKARLEALNKKLDRLKEALRELVEQSKARAGAEPKKESLTKTSSEESTKPRTAKQKRDDAKRAREYRDENEKPSLSKQEEEVRAKIQETRQKIEQIRSRIAESKKRASQKKIRVASSVGASSTNSK